jgi:anthranilate synthase component 1
MRVKSQVKTLNLSETPLEIFFKVRKRGASFLLESAERGEAGRYSVVGWNPLLYLSSYGGEKDPLLEVKDVLEELEFQEEDHPYLAGFFGYIAYDYVRYLHRLGNTSKDDLQQPLMELVFPRNLLVFDHVSGRVLMYEHSLENSGDFDIPSPIEILTGRPSQLNCNITRSEFLRAVKVAKEYIRRGDIIQVVLSRRIDMTPSPPLEDFYLRLRKINPSPYMYFLSLPTRAVIGSSPEILVQVNGKRVVTRPIAGTRRRGRTSEEDRKLEEELRQDEKEKAEHVMLVDLARNDLGRVCKFGSVRVEEFMRVEKYSHVQHLVSDVVGELRDGEDVFSVIRATFPAGTVTGAPKFRAMEIIEELEPTRRGIYAGAVGFIGLRECNLAITIRTLVAERLRAHIQVGAGIVADSVPWKEYLETKNKAAAILQAAGVMG